MFIFETSKGAKQSIHHAIYHDINDQQSNHLNKLNLDKSNNVSPLARDAGDSDSNLCVCKRPLLQISPDLHEKLLSVRNKGDLFGDFQKMMRINSMPHELSKRFHKEKKLLI
jgi:hypothetical protein